MSDIPFPQLFPVSVINQLSAPWPESSDDLGSLKSGQEVGWSNGYGHFTDAFI